MTKGRKLLAEIVNRAIDNDSPVIEERRAPDFTLTDHGSLVAVKPMNDAARDWISDNVGGETSWWGGALMVERRYSDDLLNGIIGAGFEIEEQ